MYKYLFGLWLYPIELLQIKKNSECQAARQDHLKGRFASIVQNKSALQMYEGICFKCSIISLQLPIIIIFKFIFCTVWKNTLIAYIIF